MQAAAEPTPAPDMLAASRNLTAIDIAEVTIKQKNPENPGQVHVDGMSNLPSAPGTQDSHDAAHPLQNGSENPLEHAPERGRQGNHGEDRQLSRSRSRSRGREAHRSHPKNNNRSRSRSGGRRHRSPERNHSRERHHHHHGSHEEESRKGPLAGLRSWWNGKKPSGGHGGTSRSRSRSRDRNGRHDNDRRHRSPSSERHHRHGHSHNHHHNSHHHKEHERKRSRSRSKSRSRSPRRRPLVISTHRTAPDPHVHSPVISPSKRVVHESTLVALRPSISPRGRIPVADFELAAEALRSPVARRQLNLGPIMYGAAQAKGLRPYMEDRHIILSHMLPRGSSGAPMPDDTPRSFAAVYDGHNGTLAADHAADRLHFILAAEPALRTCTGSGPPGTAHRESERMSAALVHAFETTDREILTRCRVENGRGGATGVVILRLGETLYAAHCGDSRAVLCRSGEALRLTEDHKPNLPRERKRVEDLGGRVDFARCWRVIVDPGDGRPASGLAVSRSFGDPDFKEPLHLVTATPDVMSERLTPEDSFVILASDGLWDVLSDKEACEVVSEKLEKANVSSGLSDELARMAATVASEALVQAALEAGTMDNITVVIGILKWI